MTNLSYMLKGIKTQHFSKLYVLGFTYKKQIYACITNEENALLYATMDTTSAVKGNEPCLRFKPNNKDKAQILATSSLIIKLDGDIYYAQKAGAKKYGKKFNNGHAFEQKVYKEFGQEWAFNYIKHTDGADIIDDDGTPYEIKYELGQFCHKSEFKK